MGRYKLCISHRWQAVPAVRRLPEVRGLVGAQPVMPRHPALSECLRRNMAKKVVRVVKIQKILLERGKDESTIVITVSVGTQKRY